MRKILLTLAICASILSADGLLGTALPNLSFSLLDGKNKWNASNFSSGVYFIQIQTSAGIDVRKAYLVK